jgi:hypothetical protein
VLVRSDNESVVVNLNIDAAERVEEVYWIDPIHREAPSGRTDVSVKAKELFGESIATKHSVKPTPPREGK